MLAVVLHVGNILVLEDTKNLHILYAAGIDACDD